MKRFTGPIKFKSQQDTRTERSRYRGPPLMSLAQYYRPKQQTEVELLPTPIPSAVYPGPPLTAIKNFSKPKASTTPREPDASRKTMRDRPRKPAYASFDSLVELAKVNIEAPVHPRYLDWCYGCANPAQWPHTCHYWGDRYGKKPTWNTLTNPLEYYGVNSYEEYLRKYKDSTK